MNVRKTAVILSSPSIGQINDGKVLCQILSKLNYKHSIPRLDEKHANPIKRYPLIYRKITAPFIKKLSIVFHIETIYIDWTKEAYHNAWIPNGEWISETQLAHIDKIDSILCKTRNTFEELSKIEKCRPKCVYIGFSSLDRLAQPKPKPKPVKHLHIMGKSPFKGTKYLLDVWRNNKQWPALTVIAYITPWNDIAWIKEYQSSNINIIFGPIDENSLIELMNSHHVHYCPSETEGFGHYISEALSVGAILLTTNAPPMNEHANKDNCYLVATTDSVTMGLTKKYTLDVKSLEAQINNILSLSDAMILQKSMDTREQFNQNYINFYNNIRNWEQGL